MGRAPCCEKVGLKRGPWTPEEDQKLVSYINENGHGSWRALPKKAGLLRCGKSCRLRWTNYLRPDIKRGEFSLSEEQTIIQLHALLGNRWSAIASHLPKRTDNEIKNYWNTHLKKKLLKMGLDPTTHKPKVDNTLMSSNTDPKTDADNNTSSFIMNPSKISNGSSITNHMAQWESARLEAEARLSQESQLRARGLWPAGLAVPKPLYTSTWCAKPVIGVANSDGATCADAIKALSAVEFLHALHNWEKSLQGQAGMMWPDSWRFPVGHCPAREAQAESSSCTSPCSDANTNTKPGLPCMDHSSPTSTLCSLDSHNIKQKGLHSPLVSCAHSGAHIRKLSWSDALAPPPPKLEMPSPLSKGFGGVCCKIEEDGSTFSSFMEDAVFSTDAMASTYTSSVEQGGSASKNGLKKDVLDEGTCGKMGEAADEGTCGSGKMCVTYEGVSNDVLDEGTCGKMGDVADEGTCDSGKMCVTYEGVSNDVVDEGTCGKPPATYQGVGDDTIDEGTCGKTCETYEEVIIAKDSDNSFCKESLAGDECVAKQKTDQDVSGASLVEMELDRDMKDSVVDHDGGGNNVTNKNDDNLGKDGCVGSEMISVEMFKDLPKLKTEASPSHLTRYCALLSEEIPDYWSSIMLKEPGLQQGDMTF